MSGKYPKRLLAIAAVTALLTGLLATNWMWAGAEQGPAYPENGEHLLIDPSAAKTADDMDEAEKAAAGHAVKTVSELTAAQAGQSGAPDGTAYYFKSHDVNNRSGMSFNGLNRNVTELDANPSGWLLDMWLWVEKTTGLVVVRLMGFDVNLSTIDGFGYQWSKDMGDLDDMTAGTQTLQAGWNHVRKLIANCGKGAGLTALQSLVVEQHSANVEGFGVAVSSAKLTAAPAAGELTLFDTSDEKAAADLAQVSTPAAFSVENAAADAASGFPGGQAYVMTTGEGASGLKMENAFDLYTGRVADGQRTKFNDRYRLELWVWVDDVAKTKTLRLDMAMAGWDNTGYGFNVTPTTDLDDTKDGSQTLKAGWNHVVKYVENITAKGAVKDRLFIRGIRFFENGSAHTVKLASIELVKDCTAPVMSGTAIVTPAGSKTAADMSEINVPSVKQEVVDIGSLAVGGAEYIATGTAYAATVDTAGGKGKQGMALQNLHYDIGRMIQDPDNYYLDAWIWIEDAAQVGNLVVRVFGENLIAYGGNGLIEYHAMNFDGQRDLNALEAGTQSWQTGWNHVVRKLSDGTASSKWWNNRVRAVVLEEHAADKSYTFALAALRFVDQETAGKPVEPDQPDRPDPVGPDGQGNFVAFDAAADKDAADAVQIQPANPSVVTVKNNASLTGGASGAPATGTAYHAAFDKSRSGFALEGYNWDVSNIMDKNRPGGVQYQLDMWVWIEDANAVGTFVVRLYPDPLQDTNGSLIELWSWQWNSAMDLDDTQTGVQKLQTGWNHLVKNVENLVAKGSPTVIDTISVHEHAADKSYAFAVSSISLNRIGVDDGKTYPLIGLDDKCDGINTSRYFYEVYRGGVEANAAVLGKGQDGGDNGAIWFNDVPLRAGWLARYGTNKNTVSFSATEDSILTFWLYVSDKDAISGTIFELGSTSTPDEQEKEWNFVDQIKANGWNKITLDFTGGKGGLDLNNIQRYRVALLSAKTSGTVSVAVDSIFMTETGEAKPQGNDDTGYVRLESDLNYDFDETDEDAYQYGGAPAPDTEEKKQGEASLKWTAANASAGAAALVRSAPDTLDFAIEDMNGKYIGFWMYVSDVTKVTQLAFELASTGMDTDEYQWELASQLKVNGWNYVAFPLGSGFGKNGEFDPAHIRYWRIFALGNGDGKELIIRLDDLSLLEKEPESNDDPAKQFDDDCEKLNTEKYVYQPAVELDTDAKQGTYSYQFTAPNDEGANKTVMRYYSKPGQMNFPIENWRTSYVSFWIYVNKASLVNRAAFELSSIGIDGADEFEYAFTDQLVSDTWVEVAVPLMAFDPGSLDLEHIRSMRVYMLGDGSGEKVAVKMDDLRLVDASQLPPDDPSDPDDPDDPDDPSNDNPSAPDNRPDGEDDNPTTGVGAGAAAPALLVLSGAAALALRGNRRPRGKKRS